MSRNRLAMFAAALHAMLVALTTLYVYTSSAGQAALIWVFWAIVDFPVSLLYLAAPYYSRFVGQIVAADGFLAHVLYFPVVLHGLMGTTWWYVLMRLCIGIFSRIHGHSRLRDAVTHSLNADEQKRHDK